MKTQFSTDGTPSIIPVADSAKALPGITDGLGEDVNALIALSPSLQEDVQSLDQQRWTIRYGEAGDKKGSFASSKRKLIVLDPMLKNDAKRTVRALAHEVGHATHHHIDDMSSRDAFVDGRLTGEGMATINNIRVRREILDSGGDDIGISGNADNHDYYNEIYDKLASNRIEIEKASAAIGERYRYGEKASTTGESYGDSIGKAYDSWRRKRGNENAREKTD